jgi:hypothetical protein
MKGAIKFSSGEVEKTVQDLLDIGFKGKKAVITFPGVIPNGDDFTGYWGLPERSIVVKVPTATNLEETVMKQIQLGNFEIVIDEDDDADYFGDVMDKGNLVKIAKSNTRYEDFYEEVFDELYAKGLCAYVQEYGVSEEEALELQECGACVNEQGINEEAFFEIMENQKNSKILIEPDEE